MKNLLYVIAGLVTVIWAIIFFGFDAYEYVHILLVLAGFIVIIRIFYGKHFKNEY